MSLTFAIILERSSKEGHFSNWLDKDQVYYYIYSMERLLERMRGFIIEQDQRGKIWTLDACINHVINSGWPPKFCSCNKSIAEKNFYTFVDTVISFDCLQNVDQFDFYFRTREIKKTK